MSTPPGPRSVPSGLARQPSPTLSLLALSLLVATAPTPSSAQVSALRFDPAKVPVGRVYQYLKSNRDGSHPGRVSLFVAKADRLESLKWDDEVGWATLVVAEMDWARFSVRRFESWDLRKGKAPLLKATLDTDAKGAVAISVLPGPPLPLTTWPWHSYDFDWASLGATLPHLLNPEGSLTFSRTDFVQEEGQPPRFAELRTVHLRFERREVRGGKETRRYLMEGPGLRAPGPAKAGAASSSGVLWTDAALGHLVEFELPIPDEPGFVDGRLRLLEVASLTPAEWEGFKRARLGE